MVLLVFILAGATLVLVIKRLGLLVVGVSVEL
jgi:hypothetical protein